MSETKDFVALLERFSDAVGRRDVEAFTQLFTPDAYYDDVFYGRHDGRQAIGEMLQKFFRDGSDFEWEMADPVAANGIGYANWIFSFTSNKAPNQGKRVLMTGASRYRLRDGMISAYNEWCYQASCLVGIGVPAAALEKSLQRQDAAFRAAADPVRHRLR